MLAQGICGFGGEHEVDFYGLAVGFFSFFIALVYGYYLLQKFNLNLKSIMNIVLFSAIGHFIGAYGLYWFALNYGADSCFYFENATSIYQGIGYSFAFLIMGYLRNYILGESFLGAFLISGAIAFIASIYYLLTYKILLDRISGNNRFYYFDKKQLVYPAILLLCWPSYLFWSAAIVKDNFAFLAIGMILFVLAKGRISFSSLITLSLACFLGFMVRPYLGIIFAVSAIIYILLGSKKSTLFKITMLSFIAFITLVFMPFLSEYGALVGLSSSISDIGQYAIRQQQYMSIGSSISVPTHNPYLIFLFLPYLLLANLLLPLGIGAGNLIGIISSIENAYLLGWIIFFIKNRLIWNELKKDLRITKFFLIYFIFGMACLSMMSTNFGLAMREKMMYVPALLICMLLTYAYRRILIIQHYYRQAESINLEVSHANAT